MAEEYAVELRGITKTFGPVVANHNVNLNLRKERFSPCWERTVPARPP